MFIHTCRGANLTIYSILYNWQTPLILGKLLHVATTHPCTNLYIHSQMQSWKLTLVLTEHNTVLYPLNNIANIYHTIFFNVLHLSISPLHMVTYITCRVHAIVGHRWFIPHSTTTTNCKNLKIKIIFAYNKETIKHSKAVLYFTSNATKEWL